MPAFIVALYYRSSSTSTSSLLFHEAGLSRVTSAAESRHVILLVRGGDMATMRPYCRRIRVYYVVMDWVPETPG